VLLRPLPDLGQDGAQGRRLFRGRGGDQLHPLPRRDRRGPQRERGGAGDRPALLEPAGRRDPARRGAGRPRRRGPPPRRQPRLRQRAVRRRAGRGGPVSAPRRTAAEVEDGGLGPNRRQARTMSNRVLPAAWRAHAERNLPRYTSYPTAVAFEAADGEEEARAWLAATRADQTLSAYVHVPFCKRLCWYCGCQTSVFHEYDRVRAFFQTLKLDVDLWADAIGPHAGLTHLHFGGGSPNALSPEDFGA